MSLLSHESELNCDMTIPFTLWFLCLNHMEFIWHIAALLQLPSAAKYLVALGTILEPQYLLSSKWY